MKWWFVGLSDKLAAPLYDKKWLSDADNRVQKWITEASEEKLKSAVQDRPVTKKRHINHERS
jgi:hypothetical protein